MGGYRWWPIICSHPACVHVRSFIRSFPYRDTRSIRIRSWCDWFNYINLVNFFPFLIHWHGCAGCATLWVADKRNDYLRISTILLYLCQFQCIIILPLTLFVNVNIRSKKKEEEKESFYKLIPIHASDAKKVNKHLWHSHRSRFARSFFIY